jgi:hypothetical protein
MWSCIGLKNTCLLSGDLAVLNTVQNRCHREACCSGKASEFTPDPLTFFVALKLASLRKTFWNLHSRVSVEVSIKTFPNPIAASGEIRSHTELREQIYRDPQLWRRDVISQRPHFFSTHARKLAAAIVVLSFVFCLWFGGSTYRAPLASYPYYDIQKPVPAWSEPMPLEGNYDRPETASARSSFP